MFVADRTLVVKENDKYQVNEEMLEKLDQMLNEYNIQHCFAYPLDSTNGIANNVEDVVNILYDGRDEFTLDIIYMLWLKTVRNIPDENIKRSMKRISEK